MFPRESPFAERDLDNALVRKVREELSAERTAQDDREIRRLRERLADVRERLDGYLIGEPDAFLSELAGDLDDIERDMRRI
jgi:patatin-like phospholipase/acyl hydrolase